MTIANYGVEVNLKQPTVSLDREEVALPGYELWMTFVCLRTSFATRRYL